MLHPEPESGPVEGLREKRVAIVQSNYIPWKGYFDLVSSVDEFILFDDVQYTRRDWRNRNLVKTPNGLQWLTIPVEVKGRYEQSIRDTRISDPDWARRHWATLKACYGKAACFREFAPRIEALYLADHSNHLSEVNYVFLRALSDMLGISTRISWSMDHPRVAGKTERLIRICEAVGATAYLSGPAAADYIEPHLFQEAGIRLEYFDYSGYQPYRQQFGPFEHGVTVLDLIFNEGPAARRFLKSTGQ